MLGRCVSGGSNDDISSFSTLPKVTKSFWNFSVFIYANLMEQKKRFKCNQISKLTNK